MISLVLASRPAFTARSAGMSGATDADAGLVSGVFNTSPQVGGALGLAWETGAVLGAVSIVVAALALRSPRRPEDDVARLAGDGDEVSPSVSRS